MATSNIAEFVDKLSKEIAILLVILALFHAVAAPSIFALIILTTASVVSGIGFGYFRETSYDINIGILIGISYTVLYLIASALLIIDAIYCSISWAGNAMVGCQNVFVVYTGLAIAVGAAGFIGQIIYQR